MSEKIKRDWIGIAILVCVVVFGLAFSVSTALRVHYRVICLEHGFSSADNDFCIKRVNGTDSVISVHALPEKK